MVQETETETASLECLLRAVKLKSMIYETASILYYLHHATIRIDPRIPQLIRELEALEKRLDEEFDCTPESYTKFYGLIKTYYVYVLEMLDSTA